MYLSVNVQFVSILHKTDLLSASFLSPRDRSKMIDLEYEIYVFVSICTVCIYST